MTDDDASSLAVELFTHIHQDDLAARFVYPHYHEAAQLNVCKHDKNASCVPTMNS